MPKKEKIFYLGILLSRIIMPFSNFIIVLFVLPFATGISRGKVYRKENVFMWINWNVYILSEYYLLFFNIYSYNP